MLVSRLPAGSRFDLNLDVGAVNGIKPTQGTLGAIAAWAVATAPLLEDGRPGIGGRHMAKCGPPDLPLPITLSRWPRFVDDVLPEVGVGWWRPQDLEDRRKERLALALQTKIPKLTEATANGHESVLVIESHDIQFSNTVTIRIALHAASAEVEDPLPSWIVCWEQWGGSALVSTFRAEGTWIDDPRRTAHLAFPFGR
ncbi:MAG: hypothetical protein V9F03_05100 [Microthrixaceae bacterium]